MVPSSMIWPLALLLLLFLPSFINGSEPDAEKLKFMAFDGCPMEERTSCTQLTEIDEGGRIVCPTSLWIRKPQFIFHHLSNTTSVSFLFLPTSKVFLKEGAPWHQLNEAQIERVEPGMKVICSPDVTSLEEFKSQTWSASADKTFCSRFFYDKMSRFFGESPIESCNHGYCTMDDILRPPGCNCHFGWRGDRCNEAYDPYGYDTSNSGNPVARFPPSPDLIIDRCNILLAEGCPDEETNDCIKLRLDQKLHAHCPRKLWLSTDDSWEQIDQLTCNRSSWIIEKKSSSNGTMLKSYLEPLRRVRCAHTQPTTPALHQSTIIRHTLWPIVHAFFCFHNKLKCLNGGYCMHFKRAEGKFSTVCECAPGYDGFSCEQPANVTQANLAVLMLLDGCTEAEMIEKKCTELALASVDEQGRQKVVCPLNLWVSSEVQSIYHVASKTTSFTPSWTPIDRLSRHKSRWWIGKRNDEKHDQSLTDGVEKVRCSSEMPVDISVRGFAPVTWGKQPSDSHPFLVCGSVVQSMHFEDLKCEHGYCVTMGMKKKACICQFGWCGEKCDEAYDPYGYIESNQSVARYADKPDKETIEDRCNILLAEGCPDENAGDCIKLRLFFRYEKLFAYCPRTLWLSTDYSWEPIDMLVCSYTLKRWIIKRESSSNGTFLEPRSRVRCAYTQPATPFYELQRATLVQRSFGLVDLSSTFFCFRNSLKCENGGQCVHTTHKDDQTATYCACGPQYSGDRCEIFKPLSTIVPSCSSLLVEGCPYEAIEKKECEKLQFSAFSQAAKCPSPNTLWVSDSRLVYSEFSMTHSRSSNWTRIDKLWCKDNSWQISWNNGTNQKATLSLARKVMCSRTGVPQVEADAFWDHRRVYPAPTNFAQVGNTPLAFCPNEMRKSSCSSESSYCVISWDKSQFVSSCHCNYGYRGESCNGIIDPHGFEHYGSEIQIQRETRDPEAEIDSCNILYAEGCPDMRIDKCAKLLYYASGAICRTKMWVWRHTNYWDVIDDLRCVNKRWEFHLASSNSSSREVLERSRVQCRWQYPTLNPVIFGPFIDYPYCMWNHNSCHRTYGKCSVEPYRDEDGPYEDRGSRSRQMCQCTNDFANKVVYEGEKCDRVIHDPDHPNRYNLPSEYAYKPPHPSGRAHSDGNNRLKDIVEVCDPSDLEDGCNDVRCKKLKANSTHVKCNEQLWLNFGSELLLDWHEISGVKCVNKEWKSDCAKKIGRSHLICSFSRPSSISSHLWMVFGVSVLVILIAIGLTCVICLMCRRRRKVAQALADARTPHSTLCVSSTQNSEMTTREEE